MEPLADWMDQVVKAPEDAALAQRIAGEVATLCARFPAPGLAA